MPGEAHGEMIRLTWEGAPDALYIRGHVSDEEAAAEYARHHIDDHRLAPGVVHTWARWSCEPGPDGVTQCLREYDAPGRGRFAVTRLDILAHRVNGHGWHTRRDSRRDWRTGQMVPLTPPHLACDCTTPRWRDCACGDVCGCHWSPRGDVVWRRTSEAPPGAGEVG